ncbi:MAG: hypothetical protein FJX74_14535 [Armatimonadetes bacterium]|nr:hypothetical protein [Armatimonadota bacterium]
MPSRNPRRPSSANPVLQAVDERIRASLYRPEAQRLLTWYVGRHCNFRCPYCTLDWPALARQPLPLGRALIGWRCWREAHGPAQICCTGAEPMAQPEVVRVLGAISQWHVLDLTSNMRFPPGWLDSFPRPEAVFFSASYHPVPREGRTQSLAAFSRRLKAVRDQGFRVTGVSCVGYPPLIPALASAKQHFEGEGHYFSIHLYRGSFEGRTCPEGYSPSEWDALADLLGGPDALAAVKARRTTGRPCWTGSRYFLILANGDAYRCMGALNQPPLGNLYRGTLHPSAVPEACPAQTGCPCQELWPYHASRAELAAARRLAAGG